MITHRTSSGGEPELLDLGADLRLVDTGETAVRNVPFARMEVTPETPVMQATIPAAIPR